ncbi:peptidase inhibitor family I36 protein [Microbacterium oleivorans]|uniref:Peptidase inhibitor family I36 n=1 Tax=Microbacterium oleivorans TaxID=273677 RepID=A0A4R5YIX4_9MICO|nr:peptidase inhibitor family I36 protein [Microbacterium oleivorans]TDL45294.1 hypothetical protein E2R54_02180 [Microbacterium oleivorans]
MFKKSLAVRIAAIAVIIGGFGTAGVAAANAAPSSCSSGRVCVYHDTNYGYRMGWRAAGFALENVSSPNNDKMSSWSNNSVRNACWYGNANGGGNQFPMLQYTDNPNVGLFWQDSMSSWKGSNC